MSKLLKSIWGALCAIGRFIADTVREFFDWLRKPGSKLKLVCAVLAFLTAIAALRAYSAEQAVITITRTCDEAKEDLQETIAARDMTIAEKNAALTRIENTLKEEAEKLRQLQQNNAALAAELAAKEAAAARSAEAFEREFLNKPATCTAALEAMEAACPTLRDY